MTLLRDIGEALYGQAWQTALADALGVNQRTVRRWAAGTAEMPDGVREEINTLLAERAGELHDLLGRFHGGSF